MIELINYKSINKNNKFLYIPNEIDAKYLLKYNKIYIKNFKNKGTYNYSDILTKKFNIYIDKFMKEYKYAICIYENCNNYHEPNFPLCYKHKEDIDFCKNMELYICCNLLKNDSSEYCDYCNDINKKYYKTIISKGIPIKFKFKSDLIYKKKKLNKLLIKNYKNYNNDYSYYNDENTYFSKLSPELIINIILYIDINQLVEIIEYNYRPFVNTIYSFINLKKIHNIYYNFLIVNISKYKIVYNSLYLFSNNYNSWTNNYRIISDVYNNIIRKNYYNKISFYLYMVIYYSIIELSYNKDEYKLTLLSIDKFDNYNHFILKSFISQKNIDYIKTKLITKKN
jgi:hypothetical protein